MPIIVFADSGEKATFSDFISLHIFLTIFSYLMLISPIAIMLKADKESQKEMEHTLFWGRFILIIAIGMFAPVFCIIIDFISLLK